MGFDGWVRCRCFEDGPAGDPPVPVRIDDKDEIVAIRDADRAVLREWERGACAHPDMRIAALDCANWEFRQVLGAVESFGDAFPVLLENIPQWHGAWWLTSAEAEQALDELERFAERVRPVTVDRVVAPGRELSYHWYHQTQGGNERRSLYGGGAGLTGRGTFGVWHGDEPEPRFEAARVSQRRDGDGWILIDRDTGARHRLVSAVSIGEPAAEEFEVVTRQLDAEDWFPAFSPIRGLLRAAVATGHHVHWG